MILVLGAAGFIGSYLVDHLASLNRQVVASDIYPLGQSYYRDRSISYKSVDITQPGELDKLAEQPIEAVVHLACVQPANVSERAYDPVDYMRVNVVGTLNVLEFCRKNRVRKIVYACSHRNTQAMWAAKAGTPIREDDGRAIKFTGEYAMFSISESAATDCVEHYAQSYSLQATVLRLPPVYGYGPHTYIFHDGKPIKTGFQVFIDKAEKGEPLEVWGDPKAGRDIIYVKDVVTAIEAALASDDARGLFNIASGRRLSLAEQAQTIARVFSPVDRPSTIVYKPELANSIETYVYDISKAKERLRWEPRYSFEEMLRDYQRELQAGRFSYLVEKRQRQFKESGGA